MKDYLFPFNTAEAVIDPFWDPGLSTFGSWSVTPSPSGGVEIEQNWCNVDFSWERLAPGDTVFSMERASALDLSEYDAFLLSMVVSEGTVVEIELVAEGGAKRTGSFVSDGLKHEHSVDLEGLTSPASIRITMKAAAAEGAGRFNWSGVQHRARLERHLAYLRGIADTIPRHIVEPDNISYTPRLGVICSAEELEAVRARADEIGAPDVSVGAHELVSDFILNAPDTRYNREREHGIKLLGRAKEAAIVGAVKRDAALLRAAAEYAVAEVLTINWDWGMISRFPGSSFEIRSFMQEVVLEDLAAVLDLASEFLTPNMAGLIRRRMAENGIGNINFNSWKHEYIHHCNQLPAFSAGRIAAYTALKRSWPRVRPYLELAVEELNASLEDTVLSDGGFVEGPSYLHYTMMRGLTALGYYARTEGKELRDIVPPSVLATERFGDALASTDPAQDHIPICDAHAGTSGAALAGLASLMPSSVWTTMYRDHRRAPNESMSFEEAILEATIPEEGPSPSSFVKLEEMRLASSYRTHRGKPVRLLVSGNRAGAGHTHEDKGSFVLEYANKTIAMDPGICAYSNPLTQALKHAQRHNMLVPVGVPERPHPANPLPEHVEVEAGGDDQTFHATVDCTPGWGEYYRRWTRELVSTEPGSLLIRDRYELVRGEGVAFLINTIQPVSIDADRIIVGDDDARAVITAPAGAKVSMEELPLPESDLPQRRISIEIAGTEGTCEVRISLE